MNIPKKFTPIRCRLTKKAKDGIGSHGAYAWIWDEKAKLGAIVALRDGGVWEGGWEIIDNNVRTCWAGSTEPLIRDALYRKDFGSEGELGDHRSRTCRRSPFHPPKGSRSKRYATSSQPFPNDKVKILREGGEVWATVLDPDTRETVRAKFSGDPDKYYVQGDLVYVQHSTYRGPGRVGKDSHYVNLHSGRASGRLINAIIGIAVEVNVVPREHRNVV